MAATGTGEARPPTLGIVIPAYKATFLRETLTSIAAQTSLPDEVVVADDGSPNDLRAIAQPFQQRLPLFFHRFDDNLGGRSLTAHWNRALALATADWVVLFGDDDVMQPDAVATLRAGIAAAPEAIQLLRLEVDLIDASGALLRAGPRLPPHMPTATFIAQRMRGTIESFVVEYAFRRRALQAAGGFVDFPLAWCSDDATWAMLAGEGGIHTLGSGTARVRWRASGQNITTLERPETLARKAEAALAYIRWLRARGLLHDAAVGEAALPWLVAQTAPHVAMQPGRAPAAWMAARAHAALGGGWAQCLRTARQIAWSAHERRAQATRPSA